MKKVTIVSLSVFLLFLHVQNLNNSLSAEPLNCINNESISKFLIACKDEAIKETLRKGIGAQLFCMCNLLEKPDLLVFTKTPDLFQKMFYNLIKNVGDHLKIDPVKVKSFLKNMGLNGKSANLKKTQNIQVEKITNKLLAMSESDKKLLPPISTIMLCLNPTAKNPINSNDLKGILIKALSGFTDSELNTLENIVFTNKAFAKIVNNMDTLTVKVISIANEALEKKKLQPHKK